MLRETVVLSAVVCCAFAALSIAPLDPKPKKFEGIEGCYIKPLDTVIPFGKSAPCNTHCMEYRCGKTMVLVVTCGVSAADPPCYLTQDKLKPYPGCCPQIACNKI